MGTIDNDICEYVENYHKRLNLSKREKTTALIHLFEAYEKKCIYLQKGFRLKAINHALINDLQDSLKYSLYHIFDEDIKHSHNPQIYKDILVDADAFIDYHAKYTKYIVIKTALCRGLQTININPTNNLSFQIIDEYMDHEVMDSFCDYYIKSSQVNENYEIMQMVIDEVRIKLLNNMEHDFIEDPPSLVEEYAKQYIKSILKNSLIDNSVNLGTYTFEDYCFYWKNLLQYTITHYLIGAVKNELTADRGNICWFVKYDEFVKILSSNFDYDKAMEITNFLIYDYSIRHNDIIYQPFIKCNNYLLIAPTLIISNNFPRNMQSLLIKKNSNVFHGTISSTKEVKFLDELTTFFESQGCVCYKNVLIYRGNGTLWTDIDLLIFEDKTNSVFLCEVKCPLEPDSSTETFNRSDLIRKGFDNIRNIINNLSSVRYQIESKVILRSGLNYYGLVISSDTIGTMFEKNINPPIINRYIMRALYKMHCFETVYSFYLYISKGNHYPVKDRDYKLYESSFSIGKYKFWRGGFSITNEFEKKYVNILQE